MTKKWAHSTVWVYSSWVPATSLPTRLCITFGIYVYRAGRQLALCTINMYITIGEFPKKRPKCYDVEKALAMQLGAYNHRIASHTTRTYIVIKMIVTQFVAYPRVRMIYSIASNSVKWCMRFSNRNTFAFSIAQRQPGLHIAGTKNNVNCITYSQRKV